MLSKENIAAIESAKKRDFLAEFSEQRPDLYFPESWSEADRKMALEAIRPEKTRTSMLTSIPMTCKGEACPQADVCPLMAINRAPVSKICPIELALVQQFFKEYVEELNVDTTKMVEVSMIRDLVDQEIQYIRKSHALSMEHFIQENVVGVSSEGEIITRKELHQAVELEDRLHRRKEKIRSALLATREAKAKAGQGSQDTATVISTLLSTVRKSQYEKEKLLKKDVGDEYIIDAEVIE